MNNTKQKIILELEKKEFPDLNFLFSEEVLDIALEVLNDFLEEEKKKFQEKLKIKDENINFETFEDDSKLDFFWSLLNHLLNVNNSEKIREIVKKIEPKITEFSNEIAYSKRFFEMLKYCKKNCKLDKEQEKIIDDAIKNYKIRWIDLDEKKQEELKKINLEFSKLGTNFSNNVLDSEKEFEYFLEDDKYLKEFPKSDLENARNLYKEKIGQTHRSAPTKENISHVGVNLCVHPDNWYAFDASASSYSAIMKYCNNSKIRKHFSQAHSSFASSWKYDNREIVLKIIKLKNKKAKILWYKNYAELSLEFKMAESPKQVLDLLEDLSKKAKPKALKEIEEIKNYFWLKKLNSWDLAYYSRKLKQEKYKFDDKKLKEFFEFENTKKILFDTVKKLYWVELIPLSKPFPPMKKGALNNIEVYEVYKDNKFISYFIWDYFYSENKRSGAWADELRSKFKGRKNIIVNVTNFVKPKKWPLLLSLGEVESLFHEFGHALHWMLSKSKYSELSGFWVEWDFVELPSQLMEKWVSDEKTIKNVAKHYKTWEKLDDELFNAFKSLQYYWTWNFILSQNILAIIDMMFFSGIEFKNTTDLHKKFLEKVNSLSIFKKDENYKMYCSFGHIFDWAYSAWYYSYMWADIIVEEIWAEFKKNWIFDTKTSKNFYQKILWAWSIKKASEMFEDFMWRKINIDNFLKARWLK